MLTENKQGLRCILSFGCYETAELAVTETGTRRFIGRQAPFSISVNTAVHFQPFAAMESGRLDRELESLVTPCGRPCGVLCPCLEKVDKLTARHPFCSVWGDLVKQLQTLLAGSAGQPKWGKTGDGWQGRNVCRLKGLCCLRSLNPRKHRPAKPCGKVKVHTFFWDTGIFDVCFLKQSRKSGDFGKGK